MSGILAGKQLARRMQGRPELVLPEQSMCGALTGYISGAACGEFQPMGANMGLLPPLEERIRDKQERYRQIAERGLSALRQVLQEQGELVG